VKDDSDEVERTDQIYDLGHTFPAEYGFGCAIADEEESILTAKNLRNLRNVWIFKPHKTRK
jgi:hypothetical protein